MLVAVEVTIEVATTVEVVVVVVVVVVMDASPVTVVVVLVVMVVCEAGLDCRSRDPKDWGEMLDWKKRTYKHSRDSRWWGCGDCSGCRERLGTGCDGFHERSA